MVVSTQKGSWVNATLLGQSVKQWHGESGPTDIFFFEEEKYKKENLESLIKSRIPPIDEIPEPDPIEEVPEPEPDEALLDPFEEEPSEPAFDPFAEEEPEEPVKTLLEEEPSESAFDPFAEETDSDPFDLEPDVIEDDPFEAFPSKPIEDIPTTSGFSQVADLEPELKHGQGVESGSLSELPALMTTPIEEEEPLETSLTENLVADDPDPFALEDELEELEVERRVGRDFAPEYAEEIAERERVSLVTPDYDSEVPLRSESQGTSVDNLSVNRLQEDVALLSQSVKESNRRLENGMKAIHSKVSNSPGVTGDFDDTSSGLSIPKWLQWLGALAAISACGILSYQGLTNSTPEQCVPVFTGSEMVYHCEIDGTLMEIPFSSLTEVGGTVPIEGLGDNAGEGVEDGSDDGFEDIGEIVEDVDE